MVPGDSAPGARSGDPDPGRLLDRGTTEELLGAYGITMGAAAAAVDDVAAIDTVVGVVQDPAFGPLVMFGVGDIPTELVADRAFRILPAHRRRRRRARPVAPGLTPALRLPRRARRRAPTCSRTSCSAVAALADDLPEVAELDLNPVRGIAHRRGHRRRDRPRAPGRAGPAHAHPLARLRRTIDRPGRRRAAAVSRPGGTRSAGARGSPRGRARACSSTSTARRICSGCSSSKYVTGRSSGASSASSPVRSDQCDGIAPVAVRLEVHRHLLGGVILDDLDGLEVLTVPGVERGFLAHRSSSPSAASAVVAPSGAQGRTGGAGREGVDTGDERLFDGRTAHPRRPDGHHGDPRPHRPHRDRLARRRSRVAAPRRRHVHDAARATTRAVRPSLARPTSSSRSGPSTRRSTRSCGCARCRGADPRCAPRRPSDRRAPRPPTGAPASCWRRSCARASWSSGSARVRSGSTPTRVVPLRHALRHPVPCRPLAVGRALDLRRHRGLRGPAAARPVGRARGGRPRRTARPHRRRQLPGRGTRAARRVPTIPLLAAPVDRSGQGAVPHPPRRRPGPRRRVPGLRHRDAPGSHDADRRGRRRSPDPPATGSPSRRPSPRRARADRSSPRGRARRPVGDRSLRTSCR